MKILTLVWSVGPGGTERAAVNYAIGYKMYGHQSRVLVLGEGDERYKDLIAAGINTILLVKHKDAEDAIIGEVKNWQADIIHIHNFSPNLYSYINKLKSPHTKVVETNVFSRPQYSSNYKVVNLSLQLTSWGYWRYTRRMKAAPYCPAASVIPYIVDTRNFTCPSKEKINAFRKLHGIPVDAFVAGRIGQAHASKWDDGLVDVIKATIEKNNNIHYLLIGPPPVLKTTIAAQSNFFTSRVKCIDKIEGDNRLSVCYHSFDCFVHWSKIGESFGYVLTEAMLCAVPVVTMLTPFKDNGQFEVVGHGTGGLCVSNKKEFINTILALNADHKLMHNIKKQLADGCVEKRFSFDAIMPGLIMLYESLLVNKKIPHNYNSGIINSFFSFYQKKYFFKSLLVKVSNTYSFFKLIKFAR